jgi:hypothetical protein
MMMIRGAQIFQKSGCHQKVLGTRRVIRSTFHSEHPQILGTTVQNLVATVTWRLGFVHPYDDDDDDDHHHHHHLHHILHTDLFVFL